MSKKGQLESPIIVFVAIVFGLILLSPIVLKVFNSIQTPFNNAFGNMTGGEKAQTNFNAVMNTGINFWDKIVIAAFFFAMLLLTISAFLIDTHPFWIVLYIVVGFFTIIFAPDVVSSLDSIYNHPAFALESSQLGFMNALRTHFGEFLIGISFFTGLIMFAKVKFFSSNGGVRR